MPEREYYGNEYDDFLRNTGGDSTYGGGLGQPPGTTAPEDPMAPWFVLNPPYPAPPGQNWRRNPTTGQWELEGAVPGTNNVPVNSPPPTSGPTTAAPPTWTGPTTNNSQWGYLTEPFTGSAPSWMAGPTFQPPTFTPPPDFSYQSFAAPGPDSIYADPSFQFREKQGRQALEQSAAAKGLLRTGGTLKDLINYGQNAASQEYSNIFDRAAQAHNMGLQQALGTYATNYGVDRDVYDRLYQGNKATFDAQARENELMNQRNFDTFLADFDIFDRNRKRAAEMLFGAAGMGG